MATLLDVTFCPPKDLGTKLTCKLGRSLAASQVPLLSGGRVGWCLPLKQVAGCCLVAALLQCKTKQNIKAGQDCVARKSSDLTSSAQCLAFHQDMHSFVFQAKGRALHGCFAFTLEILCLTCSLCQKGPDHKTKKC